MIREMEGTTPSQYFKESLERSLVEVLVDCAKKRPENPLMFIASSLENKYYHEEKVKDEDTGHLMTTKLTTKMNKNLENSQESTQLSSLFLKKSFDLPIETYQLRRTRTASQLER